MMFDAIFKKNSDNISGISNYCDSWCERCRFTDRCGNYKFRMKLEAMIKEDLGDEEDQEFTVHTSLEIIPRKGFDGLPDDDDDDDEEEIEDLEACFREEQERRKMRLKEHELTMISDTYCRSVYEIIKNRDKTEFLSGIEMDQELAEQMEAHRPPNLFRILSAKHEAILRFSAAVYVKLQRALDDWFDLLDGEGDATFNRMDMNGTARLVLVMIDEMIEEWIKLRDTPEGFESDINRIFDELLKVRELTEHHFPEAREFVRKGHDEM